ncbi:MAG: hypothetical protein K8U57_03120 [Planctomycetes bacterium]|nr:hypothetical protein [Planctomycetota bacterium]
MPPQGGFPFAILGFIAFWIFVCNLIGYGSGWWTLCKSYQLTGDFRGKRRRCHNLRMNQGNYGTMTVGTDANGLYLAAFFLFRPGHPPLYIPWADISVQIVKGWFWTNYMELTFALAPQVRLQIPEKYGKSLAADANLAWDSKKTDDENS